MEGELLVMSCIMQQRPLVSLLTGTNLLAGVFHTAQSLAPMVAAPVLGFEKERRKAWSLT